MRAKPSQEFLFAVRKRWEGEKSRTGRKAVIEDACKQFDPPYSYAQMTRLLQLRARSRSLSETQAASLSDVAEYAEKVWNFKMLADYDQKTFSIRRAFEALQGRGEIPAEITLKAIYAAVERLHLREKSQAVPKKFTGRDHAMSMYQIDYSKSEYFHFNKNGQIYIENPVSTKKNESRLMIAAAIDYASRVCWFRYFFVEGESSGFVRDALIAAMEEKPCSDDVTGEITGYKHILQGIPREVYFDRGAGNMSRETAEGLRKLGIAKITGSVEYDSLGRRTNRSNKKARGVVEKAIGDFKRCFEAEIWARHLLGGLQPDFTLRELNEWAEGYCLNVNNREHPVLDGHTRWELFEGELTSAKFPPDEARMYFTGRIMKTVIGRLVHVSKDKAFIAPDFAADGQKIEIVTSGRDCYCFSDGAMTKLKPQQGSMREQIEHETDSHVYDGVALRERFADELDLASAGEIPGIKSLPDDFADDIREFFEKPRTVSEIKDRAAFFAMSVAGRRANIIDFREVTR